MRDYSFGNFLHELRSRRGLTQYQLGALVGVSDKAVSKWENGSSKPQSSILYKISEILGVSVDELLSCKYHSFENKEIKGVFAMKKQLWEKAFASMCERYGSATPIEITNRFLTEQSKIKDTDTIVYFDALSVLASEAKKQGEYIQIRGGIGASLIAYLLGATSINPLKPHYYCPECHSVIFDDKFDDGWDLPQRKCSCGKIMHTDGHSIPFETYNCIMYLAPSFDISVSPQFISSAKTIIQEYFKECELIFEERDQGNIITFTVTLDSSKCSVTICVDQEFSHYKLLENVTDTCFERVHFCIQDVLNEFQKGNTDGIPEFKSDFLKNMIKAVAPNTFGDLIQMLGLSHGAGTWKNNAENLVKNGHSISSVIAYRDDVFTNIQKKMLSIGSFDTGFAQKVMDSTRKGLYAIKGLPVDTKIQLKSIGIEDWYIDSISKIKYLYPKAHGVIYIKLAATLMWYKINYPKEFEKIML